MLQRAFLCLLNPETRAEFSRSREKAEQYAGLKSNADTLPALLLLVPKRMIELLLFAMGDR
jgi:hypothetical protein